MPSHRYRLEGRIVTMNHASDVIDDGVICVEDGTIVAVQRRGKKLPEGFARTPSHRTGDTIYPGLMDLHNHLAYNVLPMWSVPKRYTNRDQWGRHKDYRKLISGPMNVLGKTDGYIQAVVRYTEVKCLVGGVTTSQGVRLFSNASAPRFYKGFVRNVEKSDDDGLPNARARIGDVEAEKAESFLDSLRTASTLLLHLSEGRDERARSHFLALHIEDDDWAITDALGGIHSAALQPEDFDVLAGRGASMVWSPLSNLLLYGETADVVAAHQAGTTIGIGSDWSPSGSKNLLGELKVAHLVSKDLGGAFTTEEIVRMATTNAARILKWDDGLGSIEPGKRADFVAINGKRSADPYLHLITARETGVTLVVINGVPRYGQQRLMTEMLPHFPETEGGDSPTGERLRVGSSRRILNLPTSDVDPLVADLTYDEARKRLADGMSRLSDLAKQLEDPNLAAAVLGATVDASPRQADGRTYWFLDLDHEEQPGEAHRPHLTYEGMATGAFTQTAAGPPLSELLEPVSLDPLTVADEDGYFERLASQPNLPDYIKMGLAPLYGAEAPEVPEILAPADGASELAGFLEALTVEGTDALTLAEQKLLVDEALTLFTEVYVHLTLKEAMHAVDPVQSLRLLRQSLDHTEDGEPIDQLAFHDELSEIFNSVRDLHTNYLLPSPFRERTAFLPFLIEEFEEEGSSRYVISKVANGFDFPDTFETEVEVLYWNGTPISQAIELNADRDAGGNKAARLARGIDSLTIRPLIRLRRPTEEWVTIGYRALDGTTHELRQPWLVAEAGEPLGFDPDRAQLEASALGFDVRTDAVNHMKKYLFAFEYYRSELQQAKAMEVPVPRADDPTFTTMPTVFRVKLVADGAFGYIRIFTFNASDADAFVAEFTRIAAGLPQEGLIIDVRGNGGGLIYAAERLLQVLTPRQIDPQLTQFITTPLTLDLCQRHAPSPLDPSFDLSPWIPSMELAVRTGAVYSQGRPITTAASANAIGQTFQGPVVLITDGLCYSATDMFAAGFKDHGIGTILGVGRYTGAGGANVWTHELLRLLGSVPSPEVTDAPNPFRELPRNAAMRVSVRRTVRGGDRAGLPLEDLGAEADIVYRMTRDDVMEGNKDLIARAAAILDGQIAHRLDADREVLGERKLRLTIHVANIDRVDIAINGRPLTSLDVVEPGTAIEIESPEALATLDLTGYLAGRLVARRRHSL